MQSRTVRSGEVLVEQGSLPDGYYILKKGEASVQRYSLLDGNTHHIATLKAGDAFGEEGLLQDNSRNASIRMTQDGEVAVLGRSDFNQLLRPILAPELDFDAANERIGLGQSRWLDCRFEAEFQHDRMEEALNLPLNQIRARSHELPGNISYIVYCDTGFRSLSATFLLREQGISAFHLQGGYKK